MKVNVIPPFPFGNGGPDPIDGAVGPFFDSEVWCEEIAVEEEMGVVAVDAAEKEVAPGVSPGSMRRFNSPILSEAIPTFMFEEEESPPVPGLKPMPSSVNLKISPFSVEYDRYEGSME